MLKRMIGLAAMALLLVPRPGLAGKPAPEFYEFLDKHVGLDAKQVEAMERGEAVVKVLPHKHKMDMAVFGVVKVAASPDYFVEQYRDIESFEKAKEVLKIKKLSDPPLPKEFNTLTLPTNDIKDLKKCKPGNCSVKIDAASIKELKSKVDWKAPDYEAQVNRIVRRMLFDGLVLYQKLGDDATGELWDKKNPLRVAEEYRGLLGNSPYLPEYISNLHNYLLKYPDAELESSEEFFYWSDVEFGLKPMIRLNHVVIYREPDLTVLASKMIYASHYFNTGLELRFLISDPNDPKPEEFYLAVLNRSRSDGLDGLFGGMMRGIVSGRLEKGIVTFLEQGKAKLEKGYRAR